MNSNDNLYQVNFQRMKQLDQTKWILGAGPIRRNARKKRIEKSSSSATPGPFVSRPRRTNKESTLAPSVELMVVGAHGSSVSLRSEERQTFSLPSNVSVVYFVPDGMSSQGKINIPALDYYSKDFYRKKPNPTLEDYKKWIQYFSTKNFMSNLYPYFSGLCPNIVLYKENVKLGEKPPLFSGITQMSNLNIHKDSNRKTVIDYHNKLNITPIRAGANGTYLSTYINRLSLDSSKHYIFFISSCRIFYYVDINDKYKEIIVPSNMYTTEPAVKLNQLTIYKYVRNFISNKNHEIQMKILNSIIIEEKTMFERIYNQNTKILHQVDTAINKLLLKK